MKKINLLFIISFLLVISLPLIFMDKKSRISERENRTLATFPHFISFNNGNIDIENIRSIPRALDNYTNDRFGFRNTYISLANAILSASNDINGNVIIGKDGWLFYSRNDDGNNINDFFKMNLFSDIEIGRFMNSINDRIEWCNRNNIKFIFLIAPNKHNVYPEYYPFERPEGITRTEQIMTAMTDNIKADIIYPINVLIQNKTEEMPLYFETDTHWNMIGAYYVFEILLDRMKWLFPETHFPEINFVTDISYDSSGDIVPMSGFSSYGKRTIPKMYPVNGWVSYFQYVKNDGPNGIIAKNNDLSLPKAIIFRDSFFDQLEPFTSTIFSSAEYHSRWFTEADKNYILENKPDVIIWEMVERSMSRIP